MEYLITPPEKTNWQINKSKFFDNFLKQWLNIKIKRITNPDNYYSLEGFIEVLDSGKILEVALHRDRQGVSLDGYLEDCAKFAVWFRSQVPQAQKLVFYDQGYNAHIELQETTTESEIMKSFTSAPQPLL